MAFYILCGKPDCKNYAHATYVAQYLHEHLPNFNYRKIEKSKSEWPDFVLQINKKNGWHMVKSPIIWKEISAWGGKAYLIGGLGEFWQYCFCYYGLESSLPKEDLENLAYDNLTFFMGEARKNSNEHRKYNIVVSIFQTKDQGNLTEQLLEEFLKIPYFTNESGCFFKLYESSSEDNETAKMYLESIADYYNSLAIFGDRPILEIAADEEHAIQQCDLLIFIEDFSRNGDEDFDIWMKRCLIRMTTLADTINMYAKRELRIIFCNSGPICFMATCMIEYCTVLIPSNIIALTSHRGLSVLSIISEMTGIPVSEINGPPVWGFIGINEYVDESNIIFKAHIYKPYKRAIAASEASTLPLGTVVSELRKMSYLLPHQHEDIIKIVQERNKNIEVKSHRKPIISKLRALRSLLMLWYAEEPTDQIISLGVCSNGSYGILPGLVFSQPCIQDQKRRWRPFSNFPLVNDTTLSKIQEFVDESAVVIQSVGLYVNSYFSSSESEHTF